MSVKTMGVLVALLVAGVGIFGLWYQQRHPRTILSTGTVRVQSASHPGPAQVLATRLVEVNGMRFEEVQLPSGSWLGCAGDCRKAALEAGPEFWAAQARDRGR
ncbi:MAG: hypothetical protein ACKVP7_27895 [Hyphomicrobiaceae bacterium]